MNVNLPTQNLHHRVWPPEIKALVDRRWTEYGL
jgi:hypothetical protein